MLQQKSNTYKNHGRTYKCGIVAPNSNKSHTIPLIQFLCNRHNKRTQNFKENAWKRRILRGQVSVDDMIVRDVGTLLPPNSRVEYHRSPWTEPEVHVVVQEEHQERHDHHAFCDQNDNETSPPSHNSESQYDPCDHPHVLKVIYQDEHLMAVHKPSGLPTMPSQTYFEYTVLNALRRKATATATATATANANANANTSPNSKDTNGDGMTFLAPPQPVHRLGVGTSGILLIATSHEARNQLSAAIREKRVKKVYRALVQNEETILDHMRIDCPIGPVPFPIGGGTIHAACPNDLPAAASGGGGGCENENSYNDSNNNTSSCCINSKNMNKAAKDALSLVRVVQRNVASNTAVVEVEIPTGRPHQIRIHMAYAGHPLVGDPLYLSGGIPNRTPKLFPVRKKEDEDMDTDDDDDDDVDGGGDDDKGEEQQEYYNCCNNGRYDGMVRRVTLPRDCGYSLHAYQISVDHPIEKGKRMTFTATPPNNLIIL